MQPQVIVDHALVRKQNKKQVDVSAPVVDVVVRLGRDHYISSTMGKQISATMFNTKADIENTVREDKDSMAAGFQSWSYRDVTISMKFDS